MTSGTDKEGSTGHVKMKDNRSHLVLPFLELHLATESAAKMATILIPSTFLTHSEKCWAQGVGTG